jgi:hypothetical protein
MAGWKTDLHADPIDWLLGADNPAVRAQALTDLLERPRSDPDVVAARQALMQHGPARSILSAQHADGYWVQPGHGYAPKYRGTVWSVIFLAQLGADGDDPGVRRGCDYVLDHATSAYGGFSALANRSPAGLIHCLNGNLCAALIDLGWWSDPRLDRALDWQARAVLDEGFAPADDRAAPQRYYKSGTPGPGFVCSANNGLPCAWGAIKMLRAFGRVPVPERTSLFQRAIDAGVGFLLSRDPAVADYPMGYAGKPSQSWFRLGFPVFYVTDVLQNLEALTRLGLGGDSRLEAAIDWLLSQQDAQGRWALRYHYTGKTWVDVEAKGRPSKWVTLRALRVLKRVADARTASPEGRGPAPGARAAGMR